MIVGRYQVVLQTRQARSATSAAAGAILAIALALALASVLFAPADAGVLAGYRIVFSYAFTNPHGAAATAHRAVYLLLCTYGFLLPLRAGLWNIGLPGQVYAGALAAFAVPWALGMSREAAGGWPPAVVVALMALAAASAGAAAGSLAGALRARLQVNEILVTMMLNSILFWLVSFAIKEGGPLMGATAEGESFTLPGPLRAPLVAGLPATVVLAAAGAILIDPVLARTALGYRIRAFGENPQAARYGGISPLALSLLVFAVGGASAGLAGYHTFAAIPGLYKIPSNYGFYGDLSFYGLITALIARGSALAAVPIAVLLSGLSVGARFAQGMLRLPFGVDYALLGLLMITFVASHILDRFRLAWRRLPDVLQPSPSARRG